MNSIHILLVEDDRDDYEFFQSALNVVRPDFRITWKQNGVEAISYLKSDLAKPDLIVMDLNMPLKDGFQTLSEIKRTGTLSHIPVHIFTTSAHHQEVCKHLGCAGYFIKPVSFRNYATSVQKMLSQEYLPRLSALSNT